MFPFHCTSVLLDDVCHETLPSSDFLSLPSSTSWPHEDLRYLCTVLDNPLSFYFSSSSHYNLYLTFWSSTCRTNVSKWYTFWNRQTAAYIYNFIAYVFLEEIPSLFYFNRGIKVVAFLYIRKETKRETKDYVKGRRMRRRRNTCCFSSFDSSLFSFARHF